MDPENEENLEDDLRGLEDADIEVEEIELEVKELMDTHDIEQDTAERAQELIDEGIDDEDLAVEIAEEDG